MDIPDKDTSMLGQLALDDRYTIGNPRDIDLKRYEQICGSCSD